MATVQTILNRKAQHEPAVFTVDDTATVRHAVVVMAERRIGGVPVLAGGTVTGIFTERDLLRRVTHDRTTLVVTHDVLDAALLADRVAVIHGGRVVEEGETARVLSRPTSDFGARFAGLNLVRGVASDGDLRMPDGRLLHGIAESPLADGAPAA